MVLLNPKLLTHYIKISSERGWNDSLIIDGVTHTVAEAWQKFRQLSTQEISEYKVIVDDGDYYYVLNYYYEESTDTYDFIWITETRIRDVVTFTIRYDENNSEYWTSLQFDKQNFVKTVYTFDWNTQALTRNGETISVERAWQETNSRAPLARANSIVLVTNNSESYVLHYAGYCPTDTYGGNAVESFSFVCTNPALNHWWQLRFVKFTTGGTFMTARSENTFYPPEE